jgi:hypothetical protein
MNFETTDMPAIYLRGERRGLLLALVAATVFLAFFGDFLAAGGRPRVFFTDAGLLATGLALTGLI